MTYGRRYCRRQDVGTSQLLTFFISHQEISAGNLTAIEYRIDYVIYGLSPGVNLLLSSIADTVSCLLLSG